jgi:DNA mismatch repair ATPase MutS
MMQCGMFVTADFFSSSLHTGLFTHYKRREDRAMRSGKFDEELVRMNWIADHIRRGAMVLFNESFARQTNGKAARSLYRSCPRYLKMLSLCCLCLTCTSSRAPF